MHVVTLADLIRRTISRALAESNKTAPSFLATSELMVWLSQGYREIVRRTHLYTKTMAANLAAGAFQAAPTDQLDRLVWHQNALRVRSGAGVIPSPLRERTYEYLESVFPALDATNAGTPSDWGWDESSGTKRLILLPPPSVGVTDGLRLDYVADPGDFDRLYDPDALTAAVVNASATVTLGTSITGLVQVDDAFGVKASAEELPSRWYRVSSIAAPTAPVMTEVYAGATNAAALFTFSQVSPLEWLRPGLIEYAPVEFALAEYHQREEGEQAAEPYRQNFENEIQRIVREMGQRPGVVYQKRQSLDFAGMRSRFGT